MQYLSNIELYYSPQGNYSKPVILAGDEFNHAVKVMRHIPGDEIYTTNGKGEILLSTIDEINKNFLSASAQQIFNYENKFSNITFCIPKLKSTDRLEFALEKCTELGITNFVVFNSQRTMHKSDRKERWERILLSAMKQSLRSYLPEIETVNSLNEIVKINGRKILLEQTTENKITSLKINKDEKIYFIFGPEGGFTKDEINLFDEKYTLAGNRLRTETAVIKCASIIPEID